VSYVYSCDLMLFVYSGICWCLMSTAVI